MTRYLAELYLPKAGTDEVRNAAERARTASDELTRQGTQVRYIRALFLGGDETCFHLYEAGSAEAVFEASRRAAIPVERVVEAVDIEPEETEGIESADSPNHSRHGRRDLHRRTRPAVADEEPAGTQPDTPSQPCMQTGIRKETPHA
jgi:Protein of unknown function (DUF4242)